MPAGDEPLLDALERYFRSTTGVVVPREAWDWAKVPEHLRPTFRVVDDAGAEQGTRQGPRGAQGAAAAEVRAGHRRGGRRQRDHAAPARPRGRSGPSRSPSPRLRAGHEVRGYPALVDEGATVGPPGVRLGGRGRGAAPARRPPAAAARARTRRSRRCCDGLANTEKLGLAGSPYPTVVELLEDCRAAVVGDAVDAGTPVRDQAAYDALRGRASPRTRRRSCARVVADVMRVLDAWRRAEKALSGRADMAHAPGPDGHARPARAAGAPRVRRRGRDRRSCAATRPTSPPLEQRRQRLVEQVNRDRQLMAQVADAPGGVPAPGGGAARRAPARRGPAPGALDARGVPRLAVGPAARHAVSGQRSAHPS